MAFWKAALVLCLFAPAAQALLVPPFAGGTCDGACGFGTTFGCFCDSLCIGFQDCCPDFLDFCNPNGTPLDPTDPDAPPSDASFCTSFCGGSSPFGCFCDDLCTLFNDCCPDAIELCLAFPPSPPSPPSPPLPPSPPPPPPSPPPPPPSPPLPPFPPGTGSCATEDACGGQAAFCSCESQCINDGDCCPDVVESCGFSCVDECGTGTPFGCFCDDLCTTFTDCCPDYFDLCVESPSPLPPPPTSAGVVGDANLDGETSVLDVIVITNSILGITDELTGESFTNSDFDGNGVLQITDVVQIVDLILN